MLFDLLAPSQGPQGDGDQKKCAVAFAIHVSHSHTKFGWISEKKKILTPLTPQHPQSPTPGTWPRWLNENPVW